MKKLSKADIARRDEIIARMETEKHGIIDNHDELIAAIRDYNGRLTTYNEVLADAQGFADDMVSEIESYIDDKSEKWQEGDSGQAFSEWKGAWEEISFEDVTLVDEPELPDFGEDETLAATAEEPSLY